MPVNDKWKVLTKAINMELLHDPDLHTFLKPIFPQEKDRFAFIKRAHRKLKTKRMLNHAHWYLTMADGQEKIAPGKPALKLIFLMALAEYITKMGQNDTQIGSHKAIQNFFKYISSEDKSFLRNGIKQALVSYKNKK